ncbi:hypothetical protein IMG5_195980 [Ichthyophthirius multifiliis]|uniref:Uncharacterized protein n=1 Tax=Ichthyophthirius multifiliis TaxID=5932 RepID=G0R514_ICHMU|nr:hypothetical protein IMG5_195980 [Ichthyophthirius multifiliis]EGR27416.1 hypothetical protein IMG5_195980 [Ichthyophthirius multifiliis]|eukprot:XP_004024326.1 hypothetical protein IMG5_195980 [Ichthyophthirius multifiliis]
MGVFGLWTILSPAGRKLNIEALTGQKLAIDVSIWVLRLIYGSLQSKNENFKNIHLICIFKRLCKLLSLGIKPVFVFDGQPPELKKNTLYQRQKMREYRELNLKKMAEKFVLKQLEGRVLKKKNFNQGEEEQENSILKEIEDDLESMNSEEIDEFEKNIKNYQEEIVDLQYKQLVKLVQKQDYQNLFKGIIENKDEFYVLDIDSKIGIVQQLNNKVQSIQQGCLNNVKDMEKFSVLQQRQYVEYVQNKKEVELTIISKKKQIQDEQKNQILEELDEKNKELVENANQKNILCGQIKSEKEKVFLFVQKTNIQVNNQFENFKKKKKIINKIYEKLILGQKTWSNKERKKQLNGDNIIKNNQIQKNRQKIYYQYNKIIIFKTKFIIISLVILIYILKMMMTMIMVILKKKKIKQALIQVLRVEIIMISNNKIIFQKIKKNNECIQQIQENNKCIQQIQENNEFIQQIQENDEYIQQIQKNDEYIQNIQDKQYAQQLQEEEYIRNLENDEFQKYEDENIKQSKYENNKIQKQENIIQQNEYKNQKKYQENNNIEQNVELFTQKLNEKEKENFQQLIQQLKGEYDEDKDENNNKNKKKNIQKIDDNEQDEMTEEEIKKLLQYVENIEEEQSKNDTNDQFLGMTEEQLEIESQKFINLNEINSETIQFKFQQIKQLLILFGIPWVESPSEAEAQCAFLEMHQLVDGIVTDDSDVFLFGGRKVYRNLFSQNSQYVRYINIENIEKDLGLDRQRLILMALFLGSDYTLGIKGVGIVNSFEIVTAFDNMDALKRFKIWASKADILLEDPSIHYTNISIKEKNYKEYHKNFKKNWEIPNDFPSCKVVNAYLKPKIDESLEAFKWAKPNFDLLKLYCKSMFGWDYALIQDTIEPLEKKVNSEIGVQVQMRITDYYKQASKFALINSNRIQKAISLLKNEENQENLGDDNNEVVERLVRKQDQKKIIKKSVIQIQEEDEELFENDQKGFYGKGKKKNIQRK